GDATRSVAEKVSVPAGCGCQAAVRGLRSPQGDGQTPFPQGSLLCCFGAWRRDRERDGKGDSPGCQALQGCADDGSLGAGVASGIWTLMRKLSWQRLQEVASSPTRLRARG